MHYIKQLLIAVDQLANCLLLAGWADETISARAWRLQGRRRRWAVARRVIDAMFRLIGQRDHCFQAWASETERMQSPPEVRRIP